jgi:16S rRNA (guanine527-N7)-methyltransferase
VSIEIGVSDSTEPTRVAKRAALPFDEAALSARLRTHLPEFAIADDQLSAVHDKLMAFLRALHQQNQIHNLSAIREPEQMLIKHIFDSLAVRPFIRSERLIDVGAGGGVPGMPLLLSGACQRLSLIDSVGKKMRAVNEMAAACGVESHVETIHARVETLHRADARLQGSSQIICRAFASIKDFLTLTANLIPHHSEWLAMKGHFPEDELAEMPRAFELAAHHRLVIPGLDAERCLLVFRKR